MTIKSIYIGDPPAGKNSLTSRANYVNKIAYEDYFNNFLKKYNFLESDFFDCRREHMNYGRVDSSQNSIHVSEKYLKYLPDTQEYMAINFVADAFAHFKYLMETTAEVNNITTENFKKIKVQNGKKNIHESYHNHMSKIYETYVSYSKTGSRHKTIIDYSTFLKNFISFLDVVANKTPILKSSYVSSRDLSVIDSGLAIEIDLIKKDKDEDKFKKYFNNPDFLIYKSIANKTGFKIDRNCPWRLIFDIDSFYAKQYMAPYEITADNLYDTYFYKTHEYDLENLKLYSIMFYNSYISIEPTVIIPKTVIDNNKNIITSEKKIRNKIDQRTVDNSIDPNYWFKLMCYIILIENNIDMSQAQYEDRKSTRLNSSHRT